MHALHAECARAVGRRNRACAGSSRLTIAAPACRRPPAGSAAPRGPAGPAGPARSRRNTCHRPGTPARSRHAGSRRNSRSRGRRTPAARALVAVCPGQRTDPPGTPATAGQQLIDRAAGVPARVVIANLRRASRALLRLCTTQRPGSVRADTVAAARRQVRRAAIPPEACDAGRGGGFGGLLAGWQVSGPVQHVVPVLATGVVVVSVACPEHLTRGDARRTGERGREGVDPGRAGDPELFVLRKPIVDRNVDRSGYAGEVPDPAVDDFKQFGDRNGR